MTGFLRRFTAPRGARHPAAAHLAAARLVVPLALVAATAACSGSALSSPPDSPGTASAGTSPGPSSSAPVTVAAPDVGTCRRIDYSAISHYTNDDPPVPCGGSHTAYTFAVDTLPSAVRVAGASIGNKSIQRAASDGCRQAFDGFIGGTPDVRALSRVTVTYFLPAQKAFNAGAHWVRCDAVALRTGTSLAPLPPHLGGFLSDSAALRDYGVCTQGVPGGPHASLVMCSEKHLYRALTALRLGGDNAPYPGEEVAGKQGQQRCADYLEKQLGPTTGYTFGWTYPTLSDWADGQRFGYCWKKSHH